MKPLWYVEKDAFGWTINCRFMLGGKKAGVAQLIACSEYTYAKDVRDLIAESIKFLNYRRESFIYQELNHAHASN